MSVLRKRSLNTFTRTRRRGIIRLFEALLLIGVLCSLVVFMWGKDRLKISLEEVLSIGSLDDDDLFMLVGIVADSSKRIYVTDAMDYSIKVFDERGILVKKTGRKGQGPGEFLAPRFIDSSEHFLYVSDQNIFGIQVFDKDLNYKNKIPILIPVSDLKVISDSEIAISTLSMDIRKGRKVFIYNSKGEITREIEYAGKKTPLMMDTVEIQFDPQGYLYLAYCHQDKIEKIDPEGKKIWSKRLLGIKKIKKEKIENILLPSGFAYKDIALNSKGHVFVLGGSFSKNPSRDVYVLSSEGKLLTTFTLPDWSHCIYIDGQDYLYSRANEGVTLKKYKVNYIYR